MEQKCANCGNGKWRDGVTAITSTCTECRYVDKGALVPQPSNWKPKEQTNADRIRAMSDEELMQFLFNEVSNNTICSFCVPTMRTKCKCDGHCKNGILEWLKQPVEVDND